MPGCRAPCRAGAVDVTHCVSSSTVRKHHFTTYVCLRSDTESISFRCGFDTLFNVARPREIPPLANAFDGIALGKIRFSIDFGSRPVCNVESYKCSSEPAEFFHLVVNVRYEYENRH